MTDISGEVITFGDTSATRSRALGVRYFALDADVGSLRPRRDRAGNGDRQRHAAPVRRRGVRRVLLLQRAGARPRAVADGGRDGPCDQAAEGWCSCPTPSGTARGEGTRQRHGTSWADTARRQRYRRRHGHEPKNRFGESLFPLTVKAGLGWSRHQTAGRCPRHRSPLQPEVRPLAQPHPGACVNWSPGTWSSCSRSDDRAFPARTRSLHLALQAGRVLSLCHGGGVLPSGPARLVGDTKLDLVVNPGRPPWPGTLTWRSPGWVRPGAEPSLRLPVPHGSLLLVSGNPPSRRRNGRSSAPGGHSVLVVGFVGVVSSSGVLGLGSPTKPDHRRLRLTPCLRGS